MTRRRGTAVAAALLVAALAAAGCGFGPGESVGSVELTVTRDFGSVPMREESIEANESDTVMRVLEGAAEITTRYGGGYVQSIDGVAEDRRDGRPYDWFFYVDGIESPIGAADYALEGGERIWWDYRDWLATNHVPAVVGSWPAPFVHGYEGERHPVVVQCVGGGGACETVRSALTAAGVRPADGFPADAIRVLVGPWSRLRSDRTARTIEGGPGASGVFADFVALAGGYGLEGLDQGGEVARSFGSRAGLVAATRRGDEPPLWVVTGGSAAGVRAAAKLLGADSLRDHYAVAVEGGQETPLPLR